MNFSQRAHGRILGAAAVIAVAFVLSTGARALGQMGTGDDLIGLERYGANAEFHLARLGYPTYAYANSRGFGSNPMWRVDFPDAEWNFLPALARLTTMSVDLSAYTDLSESAERLHLRVLDERIFQYPLLLTQQPAGAGWNPSIEEAGILREYLERGGFLLIDDFHGAREYQYTAAAMRRIFPDREIVEIPDDDPLMYVFFDLDDRIQIPGSRHLTRFGGGEARMEGPPYWLGIYDDHNRLMVGINYNIDMGDAWEHANDPGYPAPMTGQAYRLGINYVIYAMTH